VQHTVIEAVFASFVPPDADAARGIATMVAALDALPPHRRARLNALLALLWALGFSRWPLRARETLLRALADAPVAPLRSGFQALKRLALFSAYGTSDESGRNSLWPAIGYPGPRADRPLVIATAPTLGAGRGTVKADAVVIGSGAGGGVAAALLARAGLATVILEAGPAPEAAAQAQSEARAFAELYLDAGLTASDDLGVAILAGGCVGGGTTVNWSTALRLRSEVAAQWERASGITDLGAALQPAYDAVEQRLALAPAARHNRNNQVLLDGCAALGWEAREQLRNADCSEDRCGYCGFGCAYGTKRSTATTYLRDAIAAGASLRANVRAQRVRIEDGIVRGVDAGALRIDAPLVVVAAGSLRTPGLLAHSGIVSPHLGRHLKLHPTTALVAEFAAPVESWHGAMQSALCDRFSDLDDGYGATIEVAPAHPGLIGLALPWRSRDTHAAEMRRARACASLIVLTRDRGEGSVSLDGRDDVRYALAADDGTRMLTVLARAAELAFAAGALRVSTLHSRPLELARADADRGGLAAFARAVHARGFAPNRLGVFSAHQMGTARMHRDPAGGVVDGEGRVHGVAGLIVCDASVFPLASGVNPMFTIMALAHRATGAILRDREALAPES
jgi:choline dehydrogenase-like flavoprotein